MIANTPESPEPAPKLLTFREAEETLRVSHQTLYKLMKLGLPSHLIGGKRMFIDTEVWDWIRKREP